jgi:hypothetical protein
MHTFRIESGGCNFSCDGFDVNYGNDVLWTTVTSVSEGFGTTFTSEAVLVFWS